MLEVLIENPLFGYSFVFIFGAIIGSFLNVCIYRIPKELSVVAPRSSCPSCGKIIKWYHNVPIISWIFLGGKCAYCKARISVKYPLVEFLTGLLFCLCWAMPFFGQKIGGMVFVSFLMVGVLIDYKHFILPDSITVGGAIVGVLVSFFMPSLFGYVMMDPALLNNFYAAAASLLGVVIGTGAVVWVATLAQKCFKKEAMGFGDALFCGMIGSFIGWEGALFSIFGGAVFGLIIILILVVVERLFKIRLMPRAQHSSLENESISTEDIEFKFGVVVPFGPFMGLGALIYFFWAGDWIDPHFCIFQ